MQIVGFLMTRLKLWVLIYAFMENQAKVCVNRSNYKIPAQINYATD